MIRLSMKNFNMMLIKKQQKYQLYHQAKLINTNILQKYYLLIKNKYRKSKFTYLSLGKAFEKQRITAEDKGGKQVKATEEHGKQHVKSNAFLREYDYDTKKDSPSLLKLKEMFNKRIDEKQDNILKLNKKLISMI